MKIFPLHLRLPIPFPYLALSKFALLLLFLFWPLNGHGEFQKTKIAVLDFEMIGEKQESAEMGAILSEWFTTGLVKSGRFDVVERAMLQKILSEQKLSSSGMVDEASAAALGKILGVKVIITGSVLKIRDTIEINSRLISVESGSIITAENKRSPIGNDLHDHVDELITKILRNFPLTGYIVKKDSKAVIIDLGLDSGLLVGTEFVAFKEGEVIKHPKTGEVLDVEQIITGRLRITKINKNVAVGEILSEEPGGIIYGQQVKSVPKEGAKIIDKIVSKPSPPPKSSEVPTELPKQIIKAGPGSKRTLADKETQPVTEKKEATVHSSPQLPNEQPPTIRTATATKEKGEQPSTQTIKASIAPHPPTIDANLDKKSGKSEETPKVLANSSPIPSPEARIRTYKAAIFPFNVPGDASSYATYLAERIHARISDQQGITLTKSHYKLRGSETISNIVLTKDFYKDPRTRLEFLKQKGKELDVNLIILSSMDIRDCFRGTSNRCSVHKIEVQLVNLETEQIYTETNSLISTSNPQDTIDEVSKATFERFLQDKDAAVTAQTDKTGVSKGADKIEGGKTIPEQATAPTNTTELVPPSQTPLSSSRVVLQLPATEVPSEKPKDNSPRAYTAAIFPFKTSDDAHQYALLLAERIASRAIEQPRFSLIKSSYKLKGIASIPVISDKELYTGSSINIPLITEKGRDLKIDLAILAKMNMHCTDSSRGTGACDIRQMDVIFVDLHTGKVYVNGPTSSRAIPDQAIEETCRGIFEKLYLAEMTNN